MDQESLQYGQQLKEARERKKLTQQQIAAMVGVSQKSIDFYERGSRKPKAETKDKLAQVLGIEQYSTNVPHGTLSPTPGMIPIERLLDEITRQRDWLQDLVKENLSNMGLSLTQLSLGQNELLASVQVGLEKLALAEASGDKRKADVIAGEIYNRVTDKIELMRTGGKSSGVRR